MPTKEISEFHVVDTIEKPNETPKVLIENKKLKKQITVSGKVLEAQYRIGENFLVLTTEGSPFEEALYIYYLSNHLRLLDSLELSASYSEGILRNVSLSDSEEIMFSFFDKDERWLLKVYSHPKHAFFNTKYPVKRKMSAFHKNWLS